MNTPTFFALFVLLLAAVPVIHAELTIVSTEHRDEDSFKRLSEYLTGEPSDGRYSVFRSDSNRRDGFYVSLLAEDPSVLGQVSAVRIQFVRPGTQEMETRELAAEADGIEKKRILVGLTEEEWEGENSRPVAWKVEFLDEQGRPIEDARSFLWSE